MGMEIWVAIVGSAFGALSGIWGWLARRTAAKERRDMPRVTAEAAAFTLAKDHYVNIINELEEHVSWLKEALADRTKENVELRVRIADLEESVANLRTQFGAAVEALKNQSVVMVKQAEDAS
ncbi:hypothetical protein [Micromonospora chokoriensis]